jgi:ATP-dependent Lon protease
MMYAEIRSGHDWGKSFPEAPAELVLDRLAEMGPREMRRAITSAFGNAKLAHRDELQAEDIKANRTPKKHRIGF